MGLSWDEQREEGRKQLFSVFLSLLHQLSVFFFTLSFFFSEAIISFCHASFFGGFEENASSVAVDMVEMEMCSLPLSFLCLSLLFLGTVKVLDFFISALDN